MSAFEQSTIIILYARELHNVISHITSTACILLVTYSALRVHVLTPHPLLKQQYAYTHST